jgi:thiosulfate dehydrogenase [quinone] large subunit
MATIHRNITPEAVRPVVNRTAAATVEGTTAAPTTLGRRALGALRIGFGLTFLWAFVDKLLALGFHTGYDQEGNLDRFGDAAWINGGSPTEGFLAFGVNPDSPFADFFNGLAGYAVIDWLFMLGLLAIGTTLTLGIGMRFAAVAGAALYLMMYAAVMVPENNPVFDDHLIGAITVVVLALTLAGDTWGAGKAWAKTHLVRRYGFLR